MLSGMVLSGKDGRANQSTSEDGPSLRSFTYQNLPSFAPARDRPYLMESWPLRAPLLGGMVAVLTAPLQAWVVHLNNDLTAQNLPLNLTGRRADPRNI